MKKKFFSKVTVVFAQGPRAGIITCALTPLPPPIPTREDYYYYNIISMKI